MAFIGVFRLAFNGVCKCCGFNFSDFIGVCGTGLGLKETLFGSTKGKDFLGVFVATKLGVFLGVFATKDDAEETEDGTLNCVTSLDLFDTRGGGAGFENWFS